MKVKVPVMALARSILAIAVAAPGVLAQRKHQNAIIDLWAQGKTTFGVYVPAEGQPLPSDPPPTPAQASQQQQQQIQQQIQQLQQQLQQVQSGQGGRGGPGGRGQGFGGPGARGQAQARPAAHYTRAIGEALAKNPLYDFVFLNLEGGFSVDAVKAIAEGLRAPGAVSRKMLMVRIPPIGDEGAELTKYRVKASFDAGADAVAIPHVEGLEQAREAISFFAAATNDIWTPDNPTGEKLGMIMIEDPQTLTQTKEIADLKGYSVLACGVGSLGGAFRTGGVVAGLISLGLLPQDVAANLGELGTQKVLAETKRAKLANMITASSNNIQQRVKDGFQALLMSGPGSDEIIKTGRAAAGR